MLSNVKMIVNKADIKRDIQVRRVEFKKIIQQNKEITNLRGYLSQRKYDVGMNQMNSGYYLQGAMS